MNAFWPAGLLSVLLSSTAAVAAPVTIITSQEAGLPDERPAPDSRVRGVSRAPTITLEQPTAPPSGGSPFEISIQFAPHNKAVVNPASLRVTYLKRPEVDLTPRFQGFVTAQGIDIPEAQMPPGSHRIRVQVSDNYGRVAIREFLLRVKGGTP